MQPDPRNLLEKIGITLPLVGLCVEPDALPFEPLARRTPRPSARIAGDTVEVLPIPDCPEHRRRKSRTGNADDPVYHTDDSRSSGALIRRSREMRTDMTSWAGS